MIPFILAAVGGYLIYDSTRKAPNPLSNPYNILADGGEIKYPKYHGSPYDRGHSDSYYGRPKDPHYYPEGTYKGEKIINLTEEELAAYNAGYDENTARKDWGEYAKGGKVGRFKILQDETGYVEQGFYGVFDTDNNELLDIFEFKKEAEGFVKELNEKGISEADASKFNGRIENYVLKNGGKVKSKKWIQEALSGGKNKGALRRTAKKKGLLRGDENLSATDLKKLQKMGGTTAKRAHLAETLRKLK